MKTLRIAVLAFALGPCACAGTPTPITPVALENRSLLISTKVPGFEYPYAVCTKWFLGGCAQQQMQTDYYDLTDATVRAQLMNMGFVAKVRVNPLQGEKHE